MALPLHLTRRFPGAAATRASIYQSSAWSGTPLGLSRGSSPYTFLRNSIGISIPVIRQSSSSPSASVFRFPQKPDSNTPRPQEHNHQELEGEEEEQPHAYYSPHKPKRQWPPDMSKLSPKHQFRLERKYRRRAALKYARPKWTKATKILQWGIIGFIIVYAVLFMEWDERGNPFEDFRKSFFAAFRGLFSAPPPPSSMRRNDGSSSG